MYQGIISYIQNISDEVSNISEGRKNKLAELANYIRDKKESGEPAELTFICTHNSRRSHFSQIWAAVLSNYLNVNNVNSFSGGTDVTAFNPRAVAALERAGFKIEKTGSTNPKYKVYFDEEMPPQICFSKKFDDPYNPQENFAAVMTCSDADENCPYVPGAAFRISIPYSDPKEADGTPQEVETYDERCRQIATEMYYLMANV